MATVGDASSVQTVQNQIEEQETAVNESINTDVVNQFANDAELSEVAVSFQHYANLFNMKLNIQTALEQLFAKCASNFKVPQG